MEPTAGDPFCSFFELLVDAAPLLFTLASAAAHFHSRLMIGFPEYFYSEPMHASYCGAE